MFPVLLMPLSQRLPFLPRADGTWDVKASPFKHQPEKVLAKVRGHRLW